MLRYVIAICMWLASVQAMAETATFPYTAFVALESSSIRSGPDDSFYATERLSRGEAIDVYRHEGRWAAIRPPQGSYSWLPEDAVEIVDGAQSLGRITSPGTRTRVGSNINVADRGVAYISLSVGETVELLGRELVGDEGWYRITPPAGEFRWIRLADISKSAPIADGNSPEFVLITPQHSSSTDEAASEIALAPPQPQSMVETAQYSADSAPAAPDLSPLEVSQPLGLPAAPPLAGPKQEISSGRPGEIILGSPDPDSGTFGSVGASSPAMSTPVPMQAAGLATAPYSGAGLPREPTTMIRPGPVAQHLLKSELADIELQLALTVSQPPVAWDTVPLRIRAQAVIDSSDDPAMREQATAVLSKIAQFTDLQRRQLSVDTEAAQLAMMNTGPSVLATTYGTGGYYGGDLNSPAGGYVAAPGLATQYNYDGTGWLMPVVTEREDMPRFVLTDSRGEIVQFVTASPGLNLQPYVGKQIGILGQTDQLPEIGQPHIVADRIIALDKVRR